MNTLSHKIHLILPAPSEEAPVSDQKRLLHALASLGYENVQLPLSVLRSLYPLCRIQESYPYPDPQDIPLKERSAAQRQDSIGFTITLVWQETHWTAVSLEAGDQTAQHFGLAVDYGSTTIHMQLVDMNTGSVLASVSTENGQIMYGADILTRITYSLEDAAHMEHLRMTAVSSFNSLLQKLTEQTGIDTRSLPLMILSGNTTMIHFLLGLNAWTVFAAPYAPVADDPGWFRGSELSMDFTGLVYIIPAASNYVGGDIVSGLLTLDIQKNEEIGVFFDIGTNGELVIGNKEWLIAGAGAAGPALEGYISRYGMRANPGAVDHLKIQNNMLTFTTIGNEKPVGICGSGIIDLLAQMRLNGWINIAGKLNPDQSERIIYLENESQYAVIYASAEESASGTPLFFTQTDIDQYCDTKAAAYTMIECLLESVGCTIQEIGRFHLSGAFPAHSDLESAITIGIFPDLPRERYSCTANTSLDGARCLLLNRDLLKEARSLTENMYCVQLASIPDFLVRMRAAKFIPHTEMERFPSIQEKVSDKV